MSKDWPNPLNWRGMIAFIGFPQLTELAGQVIVLMVGGQMKLRSLLLLGVFLYLLCALMFALAHRHAKQITKPSPYTFKPLDTLRVIPIPRTMTPAHKFCNPDYVYAPGEIPEITGKCLPVPISCDGTRDFYTPQYDARCPGKI